MVRLRGAATLGLLLALLPGCGALPAPAAATLPTPQVVALRFEPAEATPGSVVKAQAVVLGGSGEAGRWSRCDERPPASSDLAVAQRCIQSPSEPVAVGASVELQVPEEACARFGPESPPPVSGQPPERPVDPDATGGWYQPFVVQLDEHAWVATGRLRLRCTPDRVPASLSATFRAEVPPNRNPKLGGLVRESSVEGVERWLASWEPSEAEGYRYLLPGETALRSATEQLALSWERVGGETLSIESGAGWSRLTWRPGAAAALVAVLRDDRGGLDAQLPP